LYIFIGKEGQTAHVSDGSTAKSFPFSVIRPAAAAQMHADEQAERLRADGIRAMIALRSSTAEYAPLRNSLSDRNYRQGNDQDNVQGKREEDDVQGNTKEDDAQGIDDKNNSPTALNAIIPRMTRSPTRAAVAASSHGIYDRIIAPRQPQMAHAIGCRSRQLSPKNLVFGAVLRAVFSASAMSFCVICSMRLWHERRVFSSQLQLGISPTF
jgi:hypothetical protein